jgi:hypothetical protein
MNCNQNFKLITMNYRFCGLVRYVVCHNDFTWKDGQLVIKLQSNKLFQLSLLSPSPREHLPVYFR